MDAYMWKRFLRAFAITGAAALALAVTLILLVDPLGVFPGGLDGDFGEDGLALNDRRFAAPVIVRSADYDSFLLGNAAFGRPTMGRGRFRRELRQCHLARANAVRNHRGGEADRAQRAACAPALGGLRSHARAGIGLGLGFPMAQTTTRPEMSVNAATR